MATGELLIDVITAHVPLNTVTSFVSPLLAAAESFIRGNDKAGANQLSAFIKQVTAQKGKKIDAALADALIAAARASSTR